MGLLVGLVVGLLPPTVAPRFTATAYTHCSPRCPPPPTRPEMLLGFLRPYRRFLQSYYVINFLTIYSFTWVRNNLLDLTELTKENTSMGLPRVRGPPLPHTHSLTHTVPAPRARYALLPPWQARLSNKRRSTTTFHHHPPYHHLSCAAPHNRSRRSP